MPDSVSNYQSTKFANNFKTIFAEGTEISVNLSTPYRARVHKEFDFTGSDETDSVSLSLGGGRGSGSNLPSSNQRITKKKIVPRKETYGKYVMDRPTLIAGSDSKGSFRRSDKLAVKGVVDGVNLNIERMCFQNDELGTIDTSGVTDNGGGSYDLVISAATWIRANFMLGDYINIETGNTDQFEITGITASTRTVVVSRITGSQVPADGDVLFMQGSEDNEIVGYADAFDTGVTSLFNITKQFGWDAHRVNGQSGNISNNYLADVVIDQDSVTGKPPTEIHASVGQFKNLLASVDQPQYYIGVAKSGEYKMSYKGLSLLSPVSNEDLPVLINRFIHDLKVYLINNEESELKFAPKFGWFDEGPDRINGTTQYEYPFGGELAHFFHPSYQAEIYGLAA